ncbi:MAG: hypothetical protein JWQ71_3008 [Pedosphaera sp.]|nr:hypothetical protein [Pedosphaera sp.]
MTFSKWIVLTLAPSLNIVESLAGNFFEILDFQPITLRLGPCKLKIVVNEALMLIDFPGK